VIQNNKKFDLGDISRANQADMKKILIIEDNQELRENTAELLELENYEVITAENGKTGVDTVLSHKPDLIISDVTMPELDGFDVLNMLRKHICAKKIPFIFLTSRAEKKDKQMGEDLGAAAYLTKPYEVNELLTTVSAQLGMSN
jgi:DNA-binding response OmpR family regulator